MTKIQLTWKNITIAAKQKKKRCQKQKVEDLKEIIILDDISGTVKPGQFCAILGQSGAGKTTLLNYLSNKDPSKNLSKKGEVLVNGESRAKINFSRYVGYVQQHDVLYQTLTVKECLEFAARMKLPPKVDYNARVTQILESLKLEKAANTQIGGPLVKGVSGGERKRTSIGVELITDPSLIFLDEPTTGLDSFTATSVIEILNALATTGRTVITTIHQPNSEMFALFDQLMLMACGKIIYLNHASKAIGYFSRIGYKCPELSNPAEYFMEIMSKESFEDNIDTDDINLYHKRQSMQEEKYEQKIRKMVENYENSELRCDPDDVHPEAKSISTNDDAPYRANIFKQFFLLSQRAIRNNMRLKFNSTVKIISAFIVGIIMILLIGRLGNDRQSIQTRNGALFIYIIQFVMNPIQGGIHIFPDETPVFYREYSNRMYSSVIYYTWKALSDLPGVVVFNTILIILTYFTIDLNLDVSAFFRLYFFSMLLSWACLGLGLIPGAMFTNKDVASIFIPLFIIPLMMVSGFFVNNSNFVKAMYPFEYISPFKYGFEFYIRNEYEGIHLSCAPSCDPIKELNSSLSMGTCTIATACIGIGFYAIAYLILMMRTKVDS